MKNITDKELLIKLQSRDDAAFALLYKFYFPAIKGLVVQNSGSAQDAEDIFQESVIILFQKVSDPTFILTSSLKTYIYAVARNLWLKKLRSHKPFVGSAGIEDQYLKSDEVVFELNPEPTREEKLHGWMAKITENCRRILNAIFYYREPMESLMVKMGWKNKHTADNQKYKCVQQVKKEAEKVV
ncbi:RNA polymerase sigma factor [Mucilaginibacter sp.]|uniref:RNA polymerase sigma factor n=1 Tax=Mucilaginibacter sp. TaxID=1882438 RepID=UPI00283D5FCE|nr:RNA polymerase sigma factor [Mucilaginibacter sp.]MDR3695338.1 RNA polymerase sigma factor [Mucilaginibacter sp.]